MTDFLPQALRDELALAQKAARRRKARRTVHVGDEAYAILDFADAGFAVDRSVTPPLRGLIDIFDGPTHLYQALIVASSEDGDLMRYEFKRNTAAATTAPVDFELAADRPAGLLPRL